jgi:aminopeptidase N
MTVKNVTFDKGSVKWDHSGDRILITMDDSVKAGSRGLFSIDYSGIPADGLIISDNKYGHRTFFADNWPDRAHNWIPCIDHPYDKATVDFIVTAPDHYEVVGSGYLAEESCMPNIPNLLTGKKMYLWLLKLWQSVLHHLLPDLKVMFWNTVWSWVFTENRKEGFYDYSVGVKPLGFL